MKMSCNGCRVLRKGCSDNCSIRPCLQWIKNPESQANATVFLAKFYGRAGLLNLINAGPEHLRPAIFRSLLYESCGRIVNPIYGSVGLLWSGSWQLCQQAVEAVLKGASIVQIPSETAASAAAPPLKACDIRHVSKVNKNKTKFKRPGTKPKVAKLPSQTFDADVENLGLFNCGVEKAIEEGSMVSADDTAEEASHVSQGDQTNHEAEESEVELELTLGFEPVSRPVPTERPAAEGRCDLKGLVGDCRIDLGL